MRQHRKHITAVRLSPANLTRSAALLAALSILAGCANPSGTPSDTGTKNQILLDHAGGFTDAPFRHERQNAYN